MLYEFDHQQLESLTATLTSASTAAAVEETDDQLLARVQAHDETALSTLISRHTPLLRTVIARVVHNDADTSDVLQDAFIELWNRAHQFDASKGKALGWIITMVRRRAIDRVRRRQAYDRAEERLRLETENSPGERFETGADEIANHTDRTTMLREVMATLPGAQREALELAYFRGLSQREIARTTGIPLGTIKTRLELAVRKVRNAVLQLGGREEWSVA